jgi:hypothetical protein
MNRRQLLSLAPLTLVPEPRRVYPFLWDRETERERFIRQASEILCDYFREQLSAPLVMPPGYNVEVIGPPSELLREKRLTLRVSVRPIDWDHATKLRAEGFQLV